MIRKFIFTIFLYNFIYSSKYIGIKPIEHGCILVNKDICGGYTIEMYLEIGWDEKYIAKYSNSREIASLRNINGYNTFYNFNENPRLKQKTGEYSSIGMATIPNLSFDDYLNFVDREIKNLVSIRLKITDKIVLYINFITIYITSTSNSEYRQYVASIKNANIVEIYLHSVVGAYSIYKMFSIHQYYCVHESNNICKENFVDIFPFVHKNQSMIDKDDTILNNYLLNGKIVEGEIEKNIILKFYNSSLDNSQDYLEPDESIFKLNEQNVISYSHKKEKKFLNIYYQCRSGYHRIDCSHRLYNIKLQLNCESLQMCKPHGNCINNTKNNECDCHSGWSGKYCTKSLSSKKIITIVLTILSIFIIFIIIGAITFLVKSKNKNTH